ncbi:MAG: hypothetical protein DMG65_26560 [Candidatus Angelobacter sp. Gp1-AA117]|nr:MAG: hypothetical protein DMG65_26560 [Candidatus Angelobacter sp. Gp1-AA117]
MNYSFAIWITLSSSLALLFLYTAIINLRRRHLPEIRLDEVIPLLTPVNMEALWQIAELAADAGERRRQVRLANEYLRRMSHNAALLQRIGYTQINSPNPLLAAQAQELIDAGVHVRLYAFIGLVVLFVRRITAPGSLASTTSELKSLVSTSLVPAYELLKSKAANLTSFRDTDLREALVQSL